MRSTGLDVLATTGGGLFDMHGTVTFRAWYRHGGETGSQEETSRLTRVDGTWRYLDGVGG